jgi:hypothetical protein
MEAGFAISSAASTTLLHCHANVLSETNSFVSTPEGTPETGVSILRHFFGSIIF